MSDKFERRKVTEVLAGTRSWRTLTDREFDHYVKLVESGVEWKSPPSRKRMNESMAGMISQPPQVLNAGANARVERYFSDSAWSEYVREGNEDVSELSDEELLSEARAARRHRRRI